VRVIQLSCAARFDPYHVLWAFINGADGVFLGACLQGECHHGTGHQYAEKRVKVLKRQLSQHGIDSRRLRLEFFNADDGNAFAKSMNEFASETGKLRAR
jgi:F420-non-reducing hydrogenase iron-sulfur subunit